METHQNTSHVNVSSVTTNAKRTVYDLDLCVFGVFGRKRKPQHETFVLIRHADVATPEETALKLALEKLKEIGLKGQWRLFQRTGELETYPSESGGKPVEIYSTKLHFGQKPMAMGFDQGIAQ